MLLPRALTRLLVILLLAVLALAGLGAAVFCVQGGHGSLSLPGLASDLHLSELRATVGSSLRRLEAHGPVATASALSGLAAIAIGIVILIGSLAPRRERLIVLSHGEPGVIAARRRALAQAAAVLAEQPRPVLAAKARARPRRRRTGGRLRVRVDHGQGSSRDEVTGAVTAALAPLRDSLPLRVRVLARRRLRTEKTT